MARWDYVVLSDIERSDLNTNSDTAMRLLLRAEKTLASVIATKLDSYKKSISKIVSNYSDTLLEFRSINWKYQNITSVRSRVSEISGRINSSFLACDPGTRLAFGDAVKRVERDIERATQCLWKMEIILSQAAAREMLVPAERAAPLYVAIIGDRLVQVEKRTKSGDLSDLSLENLRYEAASMASEVLGDLRDLSNIDRRTIEAIDSYRFALSTDYSVFSVERTGLRWQALLSMMPGLGAEMSEQNYQKLNRSLEVGGVLLGQFQEWRAYTHALVQYKQDQNDINRVLSISEDLANSLESSPIAFDSRIAATLRILAHDARTIFSGSDIAAPALLSALSNLFGKITQVLLESAPKLEAMIQRMDMGSWALLASLCAIIANEFVVRVSGINILGFIEKVISYIKIKYPTASKYLGF